jgi:hypothetical protein
MPGLLGRMRRRVCITILFSNRFSVIAPADFDANGCPMTRHVSCRGSASVLFCGFGGEEFSAVGDEALLLVRRHGEDGAGSGWEFVEGKGVGGGELPLPLEGAEDAPAFGGDPVDAGHVGGGNNALDFEKFRVTLGAGGVGDDRAWFGALGTVVAVQVDQGEHLAADGLVADPEDEVGAPLHGVHHMREGEEKSSNAFGVHDDFLRGYPPPPTRGYFGRNSFIFMLVAAWCAAKILHTNGLRAKYYK